MRFFHFFHRFKQFFRQTNLPDPPSHSPAQNLAGHILSDSQRVGDHFEWFSCRFSSSLPLAEDVQSISLALKLFFFVCFHLYAEKEGKKIGLGGETGNVLHNSMQLLCSFGWKVKGKTILGTGTKHGTLFLIIFENPVRDENRHFGCLGLKERIRSPLRLSFRSVY